MMPTTYSKLMAAMLLIHSSMALAAGTLADLEQRAPTVNLAQQAPALSALEEARINKQLYDRMMKMARNARDPAVINAYLELARKLRSGQLAQEDELSEAKSRADFYEDLLRSTPRGELRDDLYYELASSHDKLGNVDRSIELLKQMLQRFPQTRYASEAHFRIAEYAFSNKRFAEAMQEYQQVLQEDQPRYWQQAQYQLAWAYYKDGRYEDAIAPFERLIDSLNTKQKQSPLSKGEALRLADSYRTLSLVFVQLGGAPALAKHYDERELTDDEIKIYQAVAERYREQKQPFDIAQTYENFIARHPLAPQTADFNSALIKVYSDAGYAKDIIKAKNDYVARFALDSTYFQHADASQQEALKPLLKSNLDDLAKHYHALAQKDKSGAEYAKAAELYRQQLALATDPRDQVRIREALAQALYGGEQYAQAITEFEALAYGNNPSAAPVDNGYFALLAYQAQMKKLPANQQDQWLDEQKQSTLQYASHFPTDKNTAAILLALTAQYLDRKQNNTVVELAGVLLKLPNLSADDRKTSSILMANALFDQSQWSASEQAYRQVLTLNNLNRDERTRYQNQLAATLYRQAEAAQRQNDLSAASRLFQSASDTTLDQKVKVDAAWRSAMVVGEVANAVPLLQRFYQDYAQSEQAEGILERIVAIQTAGRDWTGASATYQQIYQRDKSKRADNALAALWLAADSERQAIGAPETNRNVPLSSAERSLYTQYLAEPRAALAERVEASERLYQDAILRKDMLAQQIEIKRQLELARNLSSAPAAVQTRLRYQSARALTLQGEAAVEQYRAIPITQPLKNSIARKQKALEQVISEQEAILNLKVADFVTGAQYLLGDSYTRFYQAINAAPAPEGLDDLAQEQYQIAVEEQTEPLKEKALEWHKANAKLAIDPDTPLWDRNISQSFEALATLSSGRYARPIVYPSVASNDAQLIAIKALIEGQLYDQAAQNIAELLPVREKAAVQPKALDQTKTDLLNTQLLQTIVLIKQGQFQQADQQLDALAKQAPSATDVLYLQGINRDLYLNQPQPALNSYLAYLALKADDKSVQKWVNILQKQLGQPLTKFNAPAAPTPPTPEQSTPQQPAPVENAP